MAPWIEPVLNHLWQSTLFAAGAALLALTLRRHQARVRHGIWLAASVKFLVPFSALGRLGSSFSWTTEPVTPFPVTVALRTATSPFSRPEYTAFPVTDVPAATLQVPGELVAAILMLLWSLGTAIVVTRWAVRWRRVARLRHEAVPIEGGREHGILRRLEARLGARVPLRLAGTTAPLEPGLFGIARPVLLWPHAVSDVLDAAQVEAIVTHELCHARRRDNLTAAVHMAVEALFWFHPVTWWIGARLVYEREQACDEWVVRRGSEPSVYAESILRTCRCCLESPLPCAAGVAGADLQRRIEQIVTAPPVRVLGVGGALLLGLLGTGAVAVPMAAGGLVPPGLGLGGTQYLQSPRQSMAFAPRRDVDPGVAARARFTSVSVAPAARVRAWGAIRPWADGRFTASGVTLRELIDYAYSPESPLLAVEIEGLPAWAASERFDVVARSDRAFANDRQGTPSELTGMIRAMLADRFRLRIEVDTRELPVLDLVRPAGSHKLPVGLRPSSSTCWRAALGPPPAGVWIPAARLCRTVLDRGRISAESAPMSWLANTVGALARRVVRDTTGLEGRFDLELTWTPDVAGAGEPPVLTSVREQLGLEIVAGQGPVDVLVVQRAEQPTGD